MIIRLQSPARENRRSQAKQHKPNAKLGSNASGASTSQAPMKGPTPFPPESKPDWPDMADHHKERGDKGPIGRSPEGTGGPTHKRAF